MIPYWLFKATNADNDSYPVLGGWIESGFLNQFVHALSNNNVIV